MLDTVLHQRLQQHARHGQLQRARINFLDYAQLVRAETHHLDTQIILGEAQFLAKRDKRIMILEQRPQNVGELHNHLARLVRVAPHQ